MPHTQRAYLSDNVAAAAQFSEDVVLDDITNVSRPRKLLNLRLLLVLLSLLLLLLLHPVLLKEDEVLLLLLKETLLLLPLLLDKSLLLDESLLPLLLNDFLAVMDEGEELSRLKRAGRGRKRGMRA